ncbi:MAG: class I SAM-dependent methyltransferase [Myxococcota bacterium]|jgi:2-polyprenyl-6-hydroxyphenyl methylase/3-demethylubiquinone-9 3-methyltransferase|nr:class I SAM-dependent methyltransferase [Myxococcota bacterium]
MTKWITSLAVVFLVLAVGLLGYGYRGDRGVALQPPAKAEQHSQEQEEYDWASSKPITAHAYILPVLERYLADLPKGARVLDLGCGNGALLATLRDRGWELHGLEISQSGVEIARKNVPEAQIYLADATAPLSGPILDQPYDAVISTEVIEHVFLPRGLVRNAMSVLKPGGKLILTTPYHGYVKNILVAVTGTHDEHYDPLYDYGHIKFWSVDTLSKLLWEAGFEDVEYTGAGRLPYLWKSLVMVGHRPRS